MGCAIGRDNCLNYSRHGYDQQTTVVADQKPLIGD
jgi:hypothetical protein